MDVSLDRDANGKYEANEIAAYQPGVRLELRKTATAIGVVAGALLAARHDKDHEIGIPRKHRLPSPTIEVNRGKKLDWFVQLVAVGVKPRSGKGALDGGNPGTKRAIGIEYGHRFEPLAENPTGPWNASGGLHVLRDAVDHVANEGGF